MHDRLAPRGDGHESDDSTATDRAEAPLARRAVPCLLLLGLGLVIAGLASGLLRGKGAKTPSWIEHQASAAPLVDAEEVAWALPDGFDGSLRSREGEAFSLRRRYDLSKPPGDDFRVEVFPDENFTHSCANYVDDGTTVLSRNGSLVLRVDGACSSGTCLKSGRVMSKDSFRYGVFSWTARMPKCHALWPALWLLPVDEHGRGRYGQWPCSGEIDVLETVDFQATGAMNLVAGYGTSDMGCAADRANSNITCNQCKPSYCTSTTLGKPHWGANSYYVEGVNCSGEGLRQWGEHRFVLSWRPGELITWVDPEMSYNEEGGLVAVTPKPSTSERPSWKAYRRASTPTWQAVENYTSQCFAGESDVTSDAPFDQSMSIVMNIAIGGYGATPPCQWGKTSCASSDGCGAAVGAEMVISDITVWHEVDPSRGGARDAQCWLAILLAAFYAAMHSAPADA